VASEEPFSTVLELVLAGGGCAGRARPAGLYAYHEDAGEHGGACNDGIEGLAGTGQPGELYFCEEGSRSAGGPYGQLLYFLDPHLGRARLCDGEMVVDPPTSAALTCAVRDVRQGPSQTLNALTRLRDGRLLAVDRNGGWLLRIDPKRRTAERWLSLYSTAGANLREALASFPGPRRMPYVSIEGIAVDPAGAIWLIDDPAIPEPFRSSALIRITGLDALSDQPTTDTSR